LAVFAVKHCLIVRYLRQYDIEINLVIIRVTVEGRVIISASFESIANDII